MSAHSEGDRNSLVVFLSAHLPSSKSKEAGQRVAFDQLRDLAATYPVHLVAFANKSERAELDRSLFELCRGVDVLSVSHFTRLLGVIRRPDLPFYVAFRNASAVSTILDKLRRSGERLVVWAEYTQMAQYLKDRQHPAERWILVCQDVLAQLCERRAATFPRLVRSLARVECRRLARWEARALRMADVVLVFSDKDRLLLLDSGVPDVRVAYPDVALPPLQRAHGLPPPPTMLFYGAMNRQQNEDAVMWFVELVLPRIHVLVPGARLLVVGANPSARVLAIGRDVRGVLVTGYVDDPRPLFAQAWISVAPLQTGAGIKLKVLECLAQGLPVVATSVGAEGVPAGPEDGLIVVDQPEGFAEECIRFLGNPPVCQRMGEASRLWFASRYRPLAFTREQVRALVANGSWEV